MAESNLEISWNMGRTFILLFLVNLHLHIIFLISMNIYN